MIYYPDLMLIREGKMRLGGYLRFASICFLSACAGACTSGGAARVEPASVAVFEERQGGCIKQRPKAVGLGKEVRPGAIDLDCFTFEEGGKLAYISAREDGDGSVRNSLAEILIDQSNKICTVEKSLMLERQAEVNGYLSIATTGLYAAATVVSGELASNILSGTASLTSGTRDHLNTHIYRNQIIQAITSAIDNERDQVLSAMLVEFDKDLAGYPVERMIREVNAYHQLCSFGIGLQLVGDAVDTLPEHQDAARVQAIDSELLRINIELRYAGGQVETALLKQKAALEAERIRLRTGVDVTGDAGAEDGDAVTGEGDGNEGSDLTMATR